jgi:hypothetical protein
VAKPKTEPVTALEGSDSQAAATGGGKRSAEEDTDDADARSKRQRDAFFVPVKQPESATAGLQNAKNTAHTVRVCACLCV